MNLARILAVLCMGLAGSIAQATVVTVNYQSGWHVQPWLTAGSNGASLNTVYGDNANAGVSPQQKCVDGSLVACNTLRLSGAINQTFQDCTQVACTPNVVAGNNGTYWSTNATTPNPTPTASYVGSLTYDDSIVINYTDQVTGLTESWYKVTGGSLAWTGTVGFEVTVNPGGSGGIGGSFFSYSWTNSSINLVTGARGSGNRCDLGIAGAAIVGSLLCGVANPASSYAYGPAGTYNNPDFALMHDLGNGYYELMIYSTRRTVAGSGNNLQERLVLSTVPVPGAVWLLGSAMGLLAWVRRKAA